MSKAFHLIGASLFILVLSACASGPRSMELKSPVTLRLKSSPGQTDITRYYSHAKINAFSEDQKVKERDEIVDFTVTENTKSVDTEKGLITVLTTTTRKDGMVDLHDLAFPELNEEIEYVFGPTAKVFKAGPYPPESVFFVPPLPIPDEAVEIGSTWSLDHVWVGMKSGIPLQMQIIGILKGAGQCGDGGRCVDIEISGNVDVLGVKKAVADYKSEVWGRLLFSLDRGVVIWSEVRNREFMVAPDERLEILACMTSVLEQPKGLLPRSRKKAFCEPSEEPVSGLL